MADGGVPLRLSRPCLCCTKHQSRARETGGPRPISELRCTTGEEQSVESALRSTLSAAGQPGQDNVGASPCDQNGSNSLQLMSKAPPPNPPTHRNLYLQPIHTQGIPGGAAPGTWSWCKRALVCPSKGAEHNRPRATEGRRAIRGPIDCLRTNKFNTWLTVLRRRRGRTKELSPHSRTISALRTVRRGLEHN